MNHVKNQIDVLPFNGGRCRQVADLIVNIQQNEFDLPITAADQPDLQDIPGFYQNGSGNFWTAELGGRVVGTIALLDIGSGEAALRKLFVEAPYRGRSYGIADELLKTLHQWAEEKKIQSIYLGTTSKFLAAHRFYEKNGFELIEKRELPGSFPVMSVDTRFYRYDYNT